MIPFFLFYQYSLQSLFSLHHYKYSNNVPFIHSFSSFLPILIERFPTLLYLLYYIYNIPFHHSFPPPFLSFLKYTYTTLFIFFKLLFLLNFLVFLKISLFSSVFFFGNSLFPLTFSLISAQSILPSFSL
jgi:hypothetical protein